MSDVTLSHGRTASADAGKDRTDWSDRMTALFMVVAGCGIWGILGYVFHSRLP